MTVHGDSQRGSAEGVVIRRTTLQSPLNSTLYWVHCMSAVWTTCTRGSGDWMSYWQLEKLGEAA